jgi:ATP-dependent protease ClpP protease subunit
VNIDMPPGLRALRNRLQPQNRKPSLRVVNAAGGRSADVYLYDEIGFWGVTAQDFVPTLNAITATEITLHVNSPGGDVFDGVAIYNALRNHPADIDVRIEGLAASAASFIAMAGTTVTVEPGAQLMIHDAAGLCLGNADEMRSMATLLDRISDTIAGIYATKAGGTVEDWRAAMRTETWYSGTEAVAAGLADAIAGQPPVEEPAEDDAEAVSNALEGWPTDAWDLSGFLYAGRDAAPAPKLPTAQAEATLGTAQAAR